MKNILRLNFILIILIFLFGNCTSEKTKKERIEVEVNLRLAEIITKKHRECLAIARDSADKVVDSLIFSQNLALDSSKIFIKPIKPIKPVLKSKIDPADVTPIFKH